MKPALIATDLDGTFLGANAVLLQSNLAAARRAIEEGVVFVIATGRPRRWLDALAELRDLDPVAISSNGAAIGRLTRPRPDFLHPIEPERALAFAAALPPELEVSFAVEYEYGWGREPGYPVGHFSGADQVAILPELLMAGPRLLLGLMTSPLDRQPPPASLHGAEEGEQQQTDTETHHHERHGRRDEQGRQTVDDVGSTRRTDDDEQCEQPPDPRPTGGPGRPRGRIDRRGLGSRPGRRLHTSAFARGGPTRRWWLSSERLHGC